MTALLLASLYLIPSSAVRLSCICVALVWLVILGIKERRRRSFEVEEIFMKIGYVDVTGYTSLAGSISPAELRERMEPAYSKIMKAMKEFEVLGFIGDAIFFRIPDSDEFLERVKQISRHGDVRLKGGTGEGVVKRAWIGQQAPRL